MAEPLLKVEGLTCGHGDAVVLSDVGFTLEAGRTLAVVGEMLGHRQPSTTKRYAHLANRVVREALEHTAGIIVAATNTARALPPAAGRVIMRVSSSMPCPWWVVWPPWLAAPWPLPNPKTPTA